MTTTSIKMNRLSVAFLFIISTSISLIACKKQPTTVEHGKTPTSHSSAVVDKWMSMQLRLMRNATGIPNQAFSRHFAYSGVAALESLKPGLTGTHKKWSEKWNGISGLPVAGNNTNYYLPANANAALAAINRAMFPNANATDKAAIDSLEVVLKQEFLSEASTSVITNSENFGKSVATAVFNWAETDGYKNAGNPYTVQVGPGLWKPTPPTFSPPSTPYWGNNRTIITGSINNTSISGLPSYSTSTGSSFYQMVKEVYDSSLTLTEDQKAMAIFWRDVPGVTSPGHWLSILQQVIKQKNSSLEFSALAYALTGAALNDVLIRCFQSKYQYLTLRPVTYIQEVMGYTTWLPLIGTPPHPEYLSNHAALSVAAASIMEELFGKNQAFTDHTYDYMGLAPRTYASYAAIGLEAGLSRFYGGIHYKQSIEDGNTVGRKVASNIISKE
jgi:hypothetical protein